MVGYLASMNLTRERHSFWHGQGGIGDSQIPCKPVQHPKHRVVCARSSAS